jgi:hypothetical protein
VRSSAERVRGRREKFAPPDYQSNLPITIANIECGFHPKENNLKKYHSKQSIASDILCC